MNINLRNFSIIFYTWQSERLRGFLIRIGWIDYGLTFNEYLWLYFYIYYSCLFQKFVRKRRTNLFCDKGRWVPGTYYLDSFNLKGIILS